MTRNYIILFLWITIIVFALVEGVFGVQGVIVNTMLKSQISQKQLELDIATLELQNYESRLEHIWDVDSLLDSAKSMGYAQPGQVVYYFLDIDGHPIERQSEHTPALQKSSSIDFQGISTFISGLSGVLTALLIVIIRKIWHSRHHNTSNYFQE